MSSVAVSPAGVATVESVLNEALKRGDSMISMDLSSRVSGRVHSYLLSV